MNGTNGMPSPAPNLRGDQVHFVRRDPATGKVISGGQMLRRFVEQEKADGVLIEETNERVAVLGEPVAIDIKALIVGTIRVVLKDSDHYLGGDALNNISKPQQNAWEEYRKSLRAAAKENDVAKMIAAIPLRDPKGNDPFASFRQPTGTE